MTPIRIGTRKSDLALVQSKQVEKSLNNLGLATTLVLISSKGDEEKKSPLYQIEGSEPGLFTKRLEEALLQNTIDIAVHSLKDLPTTQPEALCVAAVTQREAVEDCLLVLKSAVDNSHPFGLKTKGVLGTSSLRREGEWLSVRPDLIPRSIRGNVPTRINELRRGAYDGIVLAKAGLNRLGLDLTDIEVTTLPVTPFVPAPGQGAIAIECRKDFLHLTTLNKLNHLETAKATQLERRILKELEGGCTLPLGVYGTLDKTPGQANYNVITFLGVRDKNHQWQDFAHFAICEANPEVIVSRVVDYYKPILRK